MSLRGSRRPEQSPIGGIFPLIYKSGRLQRDKEREMMEVAQFEDIQTEFMNRAQQAVYCNVATVDRQGRPRSRVMHVIWDGPIGWVISLLWRPGAG